MALNHAKMPSLKDKIEDTASPAEEGAVRKAIKRAVKVITKKNH